MTRIYPNGKADVNHFHAAGGMGFLIRELLGAGLLHEDVTTIMGHGSRRLSGRTATRQGRRTRLARGGDRRPATRRCCAAAAIPFRQTGGLAVLDGNLGRAVIKSSSIPERPPCHRSAGPRLSFAGRIAGGLQGGRARLRHRGGRALPGSEGQRHAGAAPLTPPLGVLQDRGLRVALVTDGRMSGASGKVPAAIHVTPEAADGGAIARIRDGDMIRVDADKGRLEVLVGEAEFAAQAARPGRSDAQLDRAPAANSSPPSAP